MICLDAVEIDSQQGVVIRLEGNGARRRWTLVVVSQSSEWLIHAVEHLARLQDTPQVKQLVFLVFPVYGIEIRGSLSREDKTGHAG